MRISAIDSYVYTQKIQNKNTYATKPIACDTFTKSPSFRAANKELQYINDYLAGKSFDIDKINIGLTSWYLPELKIVENFKDKAIEVLNKMTSWGISPSRLFAINEANNYQLLKILVEDMNWKLFTDYSLNDMLFAATSLQNDGREEIKKVLSNENICNLIKQYNREIVLEELIQDPELCVSYYYSLPEAEREEFGDSIAIAFLEMYEPLSKNIMPEIPMTNTERELLNNEDTYKYLKENIKDILEQRLEKVIKRNGAETPQQLLGCVSDRVMSAELLTLEKNSLINKIAKIPVTEENNAIISQIIEKLNGFSRIPDNEEFRNAAIIASTNGNIELLKFFNSKGIHYINNLQEPLNNFRQEAHEILKNAKINDPEIIENCDDLDELEEYLTSHPKSDINSKNDNGESLISIAIQNRRMDILKFLAKRDDVDWNITNKNFDNILAQLLSRSVDSELTFQTKVMKLLRELPESKFDLANESNQLLLRGGHWHRKKVLENLLEENISIPFIKKIKDIYEQEGMFTLKQISDIVNYPNFEKIKDEKYNIIGENIGHFLAETFIDENNQEEFRMLNQIFKRLEECGYDFNSTDDFGITPLEKAKDCQNKVIEYSLRRYL